MQEDGRDERGLDVHWKEMDARTTLAHTLKGGGMMEVKQMEKMIWILGHENPKQIFDGGIATLDAIFDLSLGLCASRSFLGIHMYFDFSLFCGSLDFIVFKRDLGDHIYVDVSF